MEAHFKRFGVFVLILALTGCGHHPDGHSHGHDHEQTQEHESSEPPGDSSSPSHGLVLNGSEKWQMDDHTRSVFSAMAQRLEGSDLAAVPSESLEEAGTLLKEDIEELIAGCTMVGAAHNELHKYLAAYIPAVERLATSGDSESAEKVRELLQLYPSFFE